MSSSRPFAALPEVTFVALAAGLVPVLALDAGVGLRGDGFFGGFAIGVALVLPVTIVCLAYRGLAARRR